MIRPLVLLVAVEPHLPPIRVLASQHPSLYPRQHSAPFDLAVIHPCSPVVQVPFRRHSPCDGIPSSLGSCLFGRVADFDEQLGRGVLEHDGEELVLGSVVVVVREVDHWEDIGVEVEGLEEVGAGEFQVVDAVEAGGFLRLLWGSGGRSHCIASQLS